MINLWHSADDTPIGRQPLLLVRDMRITIPATSDALAQARKDFMMVFKGSGFSAVYVLGRRVL